MGMTSGSTSGGSGVKAGLRAIRVGSILVVLCVLCFFGVVCSSERTQRTEHSIEGRFAASPLLVERPGGALVVLASRDGTLTGLDPVTLEVAWDYALPADAGDEVYLLSTPLVVGDRLVVIYQTREVETGVRQHHRLQVLKLASGQPDQDFPTLELAARVPSSDGSGSVDFRPDRSLSRSALVAIPEPGAGLGWAYASFGNQADIQPWHGWIFEIDLDAWRADGAEAAVSATFLVTPETDCGVEGRSGSNDSVCGGGIWSPAGPLVRSTAAGYELLAPSGNGQLDLARRDYASTLMRLTPGLEFDPECDARACRDFDQSEPTVECMESCRNLFIPRLLPGDPPLQPATGRCAGLSFMECYSEIDYDFGAGVPVAVELEGGPSVLVQPAKDGHVYLIDADHLGTLYDREKIVDVCGTAADDCDEDQWRGMMVTQPTLAEVDGTPVVLVPTFMFDRTHSAGLVALRVAFTEVGPRLEPLWQAPPFDDPEAIRRFRTYPSRAVVGPPNDRDERSVWLVDVVERSGGSFWKDPIGAIQAELTGASRGTLLRIRLRDGEILDRIPLRDRGLRHVRPLLYEGRLFIPSRSSLEIYDIPEALGADGGTAS